VARKIADRLRSRRANVWFDQWELRPADSIARQIQEALCSADYVVVLLSPDSVRSIWFRNELAIMAHDLKARDVTIIPAVIADCQVPKSLRDRVLLDLRKDLEGGIDLLVEQIVNAPRIDFSRLSASAFEHLIGDLLERLGFTHVRYQVRVRRWEADIVAEYSTCDPFGARVTEIWLVETKFYRNERPDLESIHRLTAYIRTLPEKYKLLLVTNGQLTSTAKEWAQTSWNTTRSQVRIIEGPELKKLLLSHKDIVEEYFPTGKGRGLHDK